MLEIQNLHTTINDKQILNGIDLKVNAGEVHAIMGPNGSGKSTTAYVLAGRAGYTVTQGGVTLDDKNLLEMEPETRTREGLFLGFQYPVEIPGVTNMYMLKAALNAIRNHRGEGELDAIDFLQFVKEKAKQLNIDDKFLYRDVNVGFSGGEKKRNEILQMAVLEPRLVVLDEIDSGLDIDALKIVAEGINSLRSPDRAFVIVTHYKRLLDYIQPDYVHVLSEGRIVKSGNISLADELEAQGYGWIHEAPAEAQTGTMG